MHDAWHAAFRGVSYRRYRQLRGAVAANLPAPCTVCGDMVQPWDRWHLDHRVPISKGGAVLDPANLGPAHARCNLRKGGHQPRPPRPAGSAPSRHW